MGRTFQVGDLPMQRVIIDEATGNREASCITWYLFPKELNLVLEPILAHFDYSGKPDDYPNAESFLGRVEFAIRHQQKRRPWAIIIFPTEYPLMGHMLSVRKHPDDFLGSSFTVVHPSSPPFDVSTGRAPPLSFMWVYSKMAFEIAAKNLPQLFGRIWDELRDCDDGWCDVTIGEHNGLIRENRLWGVGEP